VRPKLACRACARIVQAAAPARPIERGLPTPGLLAQVIAAKYADHCPLYRQEGIYRRSGVELPRAMLASWIGETANLLDPLVGSLERYVLSTDKLHADDTPVPVLAPGKGRTHTGRLWAYVRDDRPSSGPDPPAVVYRYSPDRKAERPQAHLKSFAGILQADAYSGFAPLYADGRIVEAACWAHYPESPVIRSVSSGRLRCPRSKRCCLRIRHRAACHPHRSGSVVLKDNRGCRGTGETADATYDRSVSMDRGQASLAA
jgi:hypothetical protein